MYKMHHDYSMLGQHIKIRIAHDAKSRGNLLQRSSVGMDEVRVAGSLQTPAVTLGDLVQAVRASGGDADRSADLGRARHLRRRLHGRAGPAEAGAGARSGRHRPLRPGLHEARVSAPLPLV